MNAAQPTSASACGDDHLDHPSQRTVGIGDLVALSLLAHSDAVGRIVAEAGDGHIQCELTRGGNAKPGALVTVEEHQLLVKVHT